MSYCIIKMLGKTILVAGASLIGIASLKKETKDLIRQKASAGLIKLAEKIGPQPPQPQEMSSQNGTELIRALLHLN